MAETAVEDRLMALVLLIPDVHLRLVQLDTILTWEPYDRAVFLGDVFDSHYRTGVSTNLEAARWLKASLGDPRHVHLVSNHDWCTLQWLNNEWVWDNDWPCSTDKDEASRVLTQEDWAKVRPYWIEAGLLFTHAGFHVGLFNVIASQGFEIPDGFTLPEITAWLDRTWLQVLVRYAAGSDHPLLGIGNDRMRNGYGGNAVGGITWGSFKGHNPIPGLGQCCGHTVQDEGPLMRIINRNGAPMWRHAHRGGFKVDWLREGWTLDLDSNLKHYALLDTEERTLTIKAVKWTREGDAYMVEPGGVVTTIQLPPLPL